MRAVLAEPATRGRLLEALADKRGIARYGQSSVPMEDALANVALDLSGRPFCVYQADYRAGKIGDFEVEFDQSGKTPRIVGKEESSYAVGFLSHNEYENTYATTGDGLHRFVDPVDKETYLYSQFEVPDSRRVFAVFEQPDLKASFAFTVDAPEDWTVVSNTTAEVSEATAGARARRPYRYQTPNDSKPAPSIRTN